MEEIKVSVVIPVYNAEKYLEQCLDSVFGQTLKEIEIICVDDGSTDQSNAILENYRCDHPNLKVYHQENRYAGAARNNGLSHASGKYVIFWDSDDYFDLRALELMYAQAEKTQADVCICNAQDFDSETGEFIAHNYLRKPYPQEEVFNIRDCKDRIYTFTSTVPWNKLIRRSFMIDQDIFFQETKHINDVMASLLILSLAERITICKKRLIYYRMNRADSLMSTYGEKIDSVMVAYEETERQMKARGILDDPEIRQSFADRTAGVYLFTIPYVNNYTQYREYFDRMKDSSPVAECGRENLHGSRNMQRFLDLQELPPEEFLFSEYQRLTRDNAEKKQRISSMKTEQKEALKNISSLEKKNEKYEAELNGLRQSLAEKNAMLEKKEEEIRSKEKKIRDLKASWSYRIGHMIMWLPGKIRRLFG